MQEGPAILDITAQKVYPLSGAKPTVMGRSQQADIAVTDLACSRNHFRVFHEDGQYWLEPLSDTNPTFCNGAAVSGRMILEHWVQILAGSREFRFVGPGMPTTPHLLNCPPTVTAASAAMIAVDELVASIPLTGETLIGRDPAQVQIPLRHVQVSRVHARIKLVGTRAMLTDLDSANGTFVNGKRLVMPVMLQVGDRIGIGPYSLVFAGDALVPSGRPNDAQLTAHSLRRVVHDRSTGQPQVILDSVNLVVRPREFVCLLGPSGSGKTTLLELLSARRAADGGVVLLSGIDLVANFESIKQNLVVVSQRDVLHELLPVEDALDYTARLRLPADTSRKEIDSRVDEVLRTVGLAERRNVRIRHLSGGQTKRASLANELIANPSLLFLDEVTSGLDEQSDREMMALFRLVSESGKTVICVTHNLVNVEQNCHMIVILTTGGRTAFIGSPGEALEYFGIPRLGDVYEQLAKHPPEQWQTQFTTSPYYARYVASRMPSQDPSSKSVPIGVLLPLRGHLNAFLHQFPILTQRYLQVLLADCKALAGMLAQCMVVAMLVILVFGNVGLMADSDPRKAHYAGNLLFIVGISCFWFGCNNAAKEIIKELSIYSKERQVNLQPLSYFASKMALQGTVASVQASLLFFLVSHFCHLPGDTSGMWSAMSALAVAGVALGLCISAVSTTEAIAVTLVPLFVAPQIILCDAFKTLEGVAQHIGQWLVTMYWGYAALRGFLPDELGSHLPPLPASREVCLGMVLLQTLVLMLAAVIVLQRRDRRR